MTEREYRSMNGTLALQLAAHAAFGLDLVIVGMSLEDQYLRDQLDRFRTQIRSVTWVVDNSPPGELATWAYRSQVAIEIVDWSGFWNLVTAELPGPDSNRLAHEWLSLVQYSMQCLQQPMTEMTNILIGEHDDDPAKQASLFWKATMHGEEPAYVPKKMTMIRRSEDETELAQDMLEVAKKLC